MYFPEDEKIAQYLQNEFDLLQKKKVESIVPVEKENQNPVDSILEIADPTPSIHDLFIKFDKKFFWSTLGMVQVSWSNKMTTCAGMCRFEGKFGLCSITLSAPLLSFRPRKDLVQTLLHEMIHAYLFVTNNYRDRDDHGTEFHKHMFRINNEAGTNITVYHSFHDEVDYYKQHIWRCNGVCRFKKPFYGFLKRAQNRAPGPRDFWWSKHASECNGTFIKISEPEKKIRNSKNSKVKKTGTNTKDIRNFVQQLGNPKEKSSNIVTLGDFNKTVGTGFKSGTITVVNKKNSDKTDTCFGKKNNNLIPNICNNSNSQLPDSSKKRHILNKDVKIPDSVLEEHFSNHKSSSGENKNENVKTVDSEKIKETVRNIWCNKFLPKLEKEKVESKKIKLESCTKNKETVNEIKNSDQSYSLEKGKTEKMEVFNDEFSSKDELKHCPVCNEEILQSDLNEHLENCVNCSFVNSNNLSDYDDFDDIESCKNENLQKLEFEEFGEKNNIETEGNLQEEEESEISCDSVSCPCCGQWYLESEINSHLDECLTLISLKNEARNI